MSRHRSTPTTRRVRFLVRLAIGVVVFMWAPTVAQAAFSDAAVAPMSIGTYDIPAPVGIAGSFTCNGARTSVTATITDFGAVTRATGYTVTLTAPTGAVTTNNLPATTRSTTITRSTTRTGTFTLRIRATVGAWTGDDQVSSLTCP